MAENPPLAGLTSLSVPVTQALQGSKTGKQPERNKYREFLDAIHKAAFSEDEKHGEQQTRLEWDNIEGEIMGNVLTQDLISGTMLLHVNDGFFSFESPRAIIERHFIDGVAEALHKRKYLIPGVSVMNERLNRLMVSYKGQGRAELIQMLQSFQVSMQEQERTDPLKKTLGRI